jgi:filamentous hemagglutinin family protein
VRGVNQFHSFSEFGVPTGGEAFFNNRLGIQNIFSRVTGNSVSNIDGVLRANGTANLFLLNPNGIIFGAGASLNIGGSFLASTASSIKFTDGFSFSAAATPTTPLLSVSVPLGLQYGSNPGSVEVQGATLQVGLGQTLALVGGNVQLNGGALFTPTAPLGRRVELGGLAGEGTIGLTNNGSYLSLSFPDGVTRGDVSIANGAIIDVRAGGGGSIGINARNVNIMGGARLRAGIASGYGSVDSKAGDIEINATQAINIDASFISNNVEAGGVGKGGELSVDTGRLIVRDGAQVLASTFGEGPSGNLRVNATESVELVGTSADGRASSGLFASVQPGAKGAGGELSIDTRRLIVRDGAQIATGTFGEESSGNLRVNATESVELMGTSVDGRASSGLFASVQPGAKGAGGELSIDTARLIVRDGAQVSTATFGKGSSGNLRVNATESVELVGTSVDGRASSGLFASVQPGAKGAGGELSIDTARLIVRDGAQISTSTFGEGASGNLRVNPTESVEVAGRALNGFPSSLTARTRTDYDAGTLRVETGRLVVGDGAQITVSSTSSGKAGTLELKAESILLDNQAYLQANTTGGGGNIFLTTPLLLLRRGSNITTNAQGSNIPGGNITINTDNLVAVPKENSDITANSQDFRGGNIKINASGIFGIQFRNALTPLSDITATGNDSSLNGNVQIDIRDVNPSTGLAALPTNLVDRTNQIDQGCSASGANRENTFAVTGRGGLPQSPTEVISPDMVQDDLGTPVANNPATRESVSPTPTRPPKQLVEAQGWVVDDNGVVTLVAAAPNVTPHSGALVPASCQIRGTTAKADEGVVSSEELVPVRSR